MNLDEAMKQLCLGKCVGRYSIKDLKLKVVSKEEAPGLKQDILDKLGGTAIVDISLLSEDGMRMVADNKTVLNYVIPWSITWDEINAEDYYVYSDTKNLTVETVFKLVMQDNKKVYNDYLWDKEIFLGRYTDENGKSGPALFFEDGELASYESRVYPFWEPECDEEFENRYYIKEE